MTTWNDFHIQSVQERCDRIAPYHWLLERLYFVPPGIRKRAVTRLELGRGGHILEIGCGTGPNLPLLSRAVGPEGRVYGIDL
jgi:protein-L-isoaspartate O-methyltransferase